MDLGRGAVDFVGEQEIDEHRPELGVERSRVRAVHASADQVRGDEVRRELDAAVGSAQHTGQGLDGQRLGQAGDAFEQDVASGQKADQQALEHRVLADDDALDLVQSLLESAPRLPAGIVISGHFGHAFLSVR